MDVGLSTLGAATASCQPGERATGGGALPLAPPSAEVVPAGGAPVPNGEGDVPTGWQGFVFNGSMGAVQMVAYAICARAG